jgi:hypothetical protein
MTKHIVFLVYVASCTTTLDESAISNGYDPNFDPWPTVDTLERQGPPRYTSRVHSCAKMRYATLGNVLESRGISLAQTDPLSAGAIYTDGEAGLGGPNYANRVRENEDLGVATSSKMFDIFTQGAPEIIANMTNRPECRRHGANIQLFDAQNRCVADGITCLIGVPATQLHVDICNDTVARAADVAHGKQLAIAVLAAAAHTCE